MSERNHGGPAFPGGWVDHFKQHSYPPRDDGMTLRDYFAAKALQGFCAREGYDYPDAVTDAYKTADAMLRERENE